MASWSCWHDNASVRGVYVAALLCKNPRVRLQTARASPLESTPASHCPMLCRRPPRVVEAIFSKRQRAGSRVRRARAKQIPRQIHMGWCWGRRRRQDAPGTEETSRACAARRRRSSPPRPTSTVADRSRQASRELCPLHAATEARPGEESFAWCACPPE
jgi:hypothetical protein